MSDARELDTIYALKSGVVPHRGLADITVGREDDLERIDEHLEHVKSRARTQLDFIEGDYGAGKSHLLTLVREEALSRGFAVARIVADFDSTPLHRPALVLRAISRNLELPDRAGIGLEPLLRNLVGSPRFAGQSEALYDKWLHPRTGTIDESYSFWPAGLYAATSSPDLVFKISRWFSGEPIPINPLRREISGVCRPPKRMSVTARDLPTIIAGLAKSLRVLGYSGLVLEVDELENALADVAAPTFRRNSVSFLANVARLKCPLYIVGAVTPATAATVRNDARIGWGSLDAWAPDYRFVLKRLDGGAPVEVEELQPEDLVALASRLIALHERAFGWQMDGQLTKSAIPALVQLAGEQHLPTRSYVRALIQIRAL